jgi:opacity protein-like surface antigen
MSRSKKKTAATVIMVASLLTAHSAMAETGAGWYAGANIGSAKSSLDNRLSIENEDLSATAVAIHGGYRFARHFAIEATYADMGDYRYTLTNCIEVCIPELVPAEVEHSVKRLDLALAGSISVGERLEAYARLGVANTSVDTKARSLSGTSQRERSGLAATYGVGMRAHFDGPWSLRLQWDRTRYSEDLEMDIDVVWLGAEYRFGNRHR